MNVTTLKSTDEPEKVVCQAARGDYHDGFVGDTEYGELMESVQYDDKHVQAVADVFDYNCNPDGVDADIVSPETELKAKQYALLERLFRRQHWGPFEHPQITIAVEGVSRSCMAQITRHRHVSFDVQSQRYVDFGEKDDPVKTPRSLTDPDHFSRETGELSLGDKHREQFEKSYKQYVKQAVEEYEAMIDAGVPKEDARFILPIGTKVNFTMSLNARMLLHIEDMRKTGEAQWEIREMTEMVHDEFAQWMPMTAHLYEQHGPNKLAP